MSRDGSRSVATWQPTCPDPQNCQKLSLAKCQKMPTAVDHEARNSSKKTELAPEFDKRRKSRVLAQREAVSRYSVDAAAGTEHLVSGRDSVSRSWGMARLASSNLLPATYEHNKVTSEAPQGTAGDTQKNFGEYRKVKIHATVSPNPTIRGTAVSFNARLGTASAIAMIISAKGTATIRSTK